jgi:hypothetical protein
MACNNFDYATSRRDFLRTAGCGFGAVALAALMKQPLLGATGTVTPAAEQLARAGKAKNVIFLFMEGGPSHLDTFDHKPLVNELSGQKLPPSFKPPILAMGESNAPIMGSKRTWKQHGKSGLWVSDWFRTSRTHADDLAVIKSCVSRRHQSRGGVCQMNTGSIFGGRPSLGAWVDYGIGTRTGTCPGFVVIKDSEKEVINGTRNWGTGFMPAVHQGVEFSSGRCADPNLDTPKGMIAQRQREKLDLLAQLNRAHAKTARTTPNWRRASAATNSPTKCRRRRPARWTSRKRPRRRKRSTA